MKNPFKKKEDKDSIPYYTVKIDQEKFQFLVEVDAESGATSLKTFNKNKPVPLGVIANSLLALRDSVVGELTVEREKQKLANAGKGEQVPQAQG